MPERSASESIAAGPARFAGVRTVAGTCAILAAAVGGMYASFTIESLLWYAPIGAAFAACSIIAFPTHQQRAMAAGAAPLAFGWIGALAVAAGALAVAALAITRRFKNYAAAMLERTESRSGRAVRGRGPR